MHSQTITALFASMARVPPAPLAPAVRRRPSAAARPGGHDEISTQPTTQGEQP